MTVTVFVHPIDPEAHPTVPPGWRWAVHLGGDPRRACLNAGWCPSRNEAALEGEMVGVTVAKALRHAGTPTEYCVRDLSDDPIPAGFDFITARA